MNLDAVIAALEALRAEHGGDVDVTAWHYGGGMEDLCDVAPTFNAETRTVTFEQCGAHSSHARR